MPLFLALNNEFCFFIPRLTGWLDAWYGCCSWPPSQPHRSSHSSLITLRWPGHYVCCNQRNICFLAFCRPASDRSSWKKSESGNAALLVYVSVGRCHSNIYTNQLAERLRDCARSIYRLGDCTLAACGDDAVTRQRDFTVACRKFVVTWTHVYIDVVCLVACSMLSSAHKIIWTSCRKCFRIASGGAVS